MRTLTTEKANQSYKQLVRLQPLPNLSKAGLPALDHLFFNHRIRTKTKRGISFAEAQQNPEIMEHMEALAVKYRRKLTEDTIYQMFCLWYGSVNQFRPAYAKWLISRYSPKVGLLDFSAGWGGRAMACMSLGIPYTGVDTNINLQEGYKQLQEYDPTTPVNMIWKPSEQVDFKQYSYDMVFTSPPYWTTEVYECMPSYSCKREWLDVFLTPVIMKAWDGLLSEGTMALNMPEPFYTEVKDRLPPVLEILIMPLSNRNLKHSKTAQEYVYVWRKI